MSDIKKEYKKIIKELETNLKNKEDLEFAKSQIDKITNLFLEEIDNLQNKTEDRMEKIINKMAVLEEKISMVEKDLDSIEKDIYVDEECDFQIVCPYCNYEFVIDCGDLKDEVKCPECNNIIELDWDAELDEEECSHDCSCCHDKCDEEKQEDEDEDM